MEAARTVEHVFSEERPRILATLIRLLGGDFDRAEDALASALEAALRQWPADAIPANPRAWLIRAARNKAIDDARRTRRAEKRAQQLGEASADVLPPDEETEAEELATLDDRLRLIFTCCHPALSLDAQVALCLRTLGGLGTEEIARAFLVPVATMAQRLVRAKQKIKVARIPYTVPAEAELDDRLAAVLAVVYLVFNEGYAATSGEALVRRDLASEAIRLGRLLVELLPERRGPKGLLALMLLHDSRRDARATAAGDLVLLEDQDRNRWDRAQIDEGLALVDAALAGGEPDAYAIQAALAALHARAPSAAETDWAQIAGLYAVLFALAPSPVVRLNHAVAVAHADGPEAGLRLLDALDAEGALRDYHLLPAVRADLLRRLGRRDEAETAYRRARDLAGNETEKRFLDARLAQLRAKD
jgi:RNA polymerase sigma-70 factor (ECF subfamily)